jgi:hypothetical protein
MKHCHLNDFVLLESSILRDLHRMELEVEENVKSFKLEAGFEPTTYYFNNEILDISFRPNFIDLSVSQANKGI